ncbi:MAG TPA: hypothetical protein DCE42_24765 [Myxococcales bacterium]|nr:hypothetical protein [Deltaproteobacteria bacterium]HAA58001.1 hypothetical protein [Myxococcales bacterium]
MKSVKESTPSHTNLLIQDIDGTVPSNINCPSNKQTHEINQENKKKQTFKKNTCVPFSVTREA